MDNFVYESNLSYFNIYQTEVHHIQEQSPALYIFFLSPNYFRTVPNFSINQKHHKNKNTIKIKYH